MGSQTETKLSLEGRIVPEWVAMLEHECPQALRDSRRVQLDLAAVTFIDARGVEVLRRLVNDGIAIVPGYLAILLTLPVAYHCIFLLGFETTSPRVAIHSTLGSAFYGALLVKVILVHSGGLPGWVLPVAGGLLFAILAGLWATSSLYLFSSNPITL